MYLEVFRFDDRDRRASMIGRSRLFHLRLRSFANDSRLQPTRSVSRPMLRDLEHDSLDAKLGAISNGRGDGGIAGFIGKKLPEIHPHRQQRSVNGV